ncbi:hypothetical protein A1Q1_03610 [Trichosporon asahii var. asahii CBS 2479]|uniref:SET domain-containing protein n=1 Tax=Trichosporon asahii var. asahii (strain ATCC 90039 / CBS 2479 / JCM 2466 / KCTC 7840 / NBRC 103889/ NCYC 2677 / UAMH 7654) TaxID=1186058 RepID=J5QIH8_TRIAS|nr:hypothetical protein A1Q1_03610 [Trichosporon asahii var. asahii CBS 2479]EJT47498.1 hypothetical protein A1Q1_03610 [Trichosporon asahii var. asahii CBS 2479]
MSNKSAKRNKARRNKEKRDRDELRAANEYEDTASATSTSGAGPSSASGINYLTEEPCLFEVRSIPGKDLGLVATADIPKGTRILKEAPLLVVKLGKPVQIEAAVSAAIQSFGPWKKKALLGLYNCHRDTKYKLHGIFVTNALPRGEGAGAVFEYISRINHSCRPNSHICWNDNLGMETVHAIRTISSGEEITINYGHTGVSEERQAWLKKRFKFDCACEVCGLGQRQLRASDSTRRRIRDLTDALHRSLSVPHIPVNIDTIRQNYLDVQELIKGEFGPDCAMRAEIYELAYDIAVLEGRQFHAERQAQAAYDIRVVAQGYDHPDAEEILKTMCDPVSDPCFGVCAPKPRNGRDQ